MPRGGYRANAGRPKGRKDKKTLEKERVAAAYRQRILRHADQLFAAQMAVAGGCSFVFQKLPGGKSKIVTDPKVLQRFVDDEAGEDDGVFWLYTERPNNFAIQDMLNRAMGKPVEHHELTGKDGEPVRHVVEVRLIGAGA